MKKTTMLAAALSGAALLTACSGGNGQGAGATDGPLVNGQTFSMAILTDPGTLDPAMSVSSDARQVQAFLYDTLTRVAPDGSDESYLASKWSAGLTKASFTLRAGVTCSDGAALTPTMVADNFNFIGDKKNGSPLNGFVVPAGTKAVGDDAAGTLTVTSPTPDAFLLRDLSSVPIVCAKGMADRKLLANGADGTGMFTVKSRSADGVITLARRTDYAWGPGDFTSKQDGLPDVVTIRTVQSPSTAANLLLSNDLDAAKVTGPDVDRLAAAKLKEETYPSVAGQMFFNEDPRRPLSSETVRRALVTGIDLANLRKVLTGGKGVPSAGMVPVDPAVCPGNPADGAFPDFDEDKAVSLLNGAKPEIKVLYPAGMGPDFDAAMEYVKSSWDKLGVSVDLVAANDAKIGQTLDDTGDWDVSFVTLGFTLPSQMVPFLSGPAGPTGLNSGHVDNTAFVTAADAALKQPGLSGCDNWNKAEKALYERVDVVPFATEPRAWFLRKATFALVQGSIVPTSIRMHG